MQTRTCVACDNSPMDDRRLGGALRALRVRRDWRQIDAATEAGVSHATISRAEPGQLDALSIRTLRAIAGLMDARLDLSLRQCGADLDRMLSARHAALQEWCARRFGSLHGWQYCPEVTLSTYGERGVIDALAWHEATGTLLVIELTTEIVDVHGLIASMDRRRRLAPGIARAIGWTAGAPVATSAWVAVVESATNRRRAAAPRRTHGSGGESAGGGRRVCGTLRHVALVLRG